MRFTTYHRVEGYVSCSALQGTSEEHVVIVGDKNCNLLDASARYDWSL